MGLEMTNATIKALTAILADHLYAIEDADSGQLDDDFAVNLLEQAAAGLQSLDPPAARQVIAAMDELVAAELDPQRKSFLNGFAEAFGLTIGGNAN
jgi:hypothetical protein